ncbi:MAG: hypothetical protein LUH11_03430, partial [Candidatus Gastranaerophilales bacterium]|nr:hypothetical protein [Candidatus Gastranaerophilales bacterium]
MDFLYEFEDQTFKLSEYNKKKVVDNIVEKYNNLYEARKTQIDETNVLRDEIYQRKSYVEDKDKEYKIFKLPELTELWQSLKAHLYENIYKTPESMFDCQGEDEQSQSYAATQKAMLVKAFTKMKFQQQMEKMTDCIVDSGEAVLYVGWEKRIKKVRRKKTSLEKIQDNILLGFQSLFGNSEHAKVEFENLKSKKQNYVEYEKLVYDGPVVKCIDNLEFVFDPFKSDDFENADMMYRTHKSYYEIIDNRNYQLSTEVKNDLKNVEDEFNREEYQIKKDGDKDKSKDGLIELIEYYGNIKIQDKLIRNYLIVIANKKHIIRFEPNPYLHKPFVYGNIIEDPDTRRGVSPLRVAKSLNDISSEILSKQVYCLDLIINPAWLSPKKMLSKDVKIKPGEVIEYESDELAKTPLKPEKLDFSKAFTGFDFISYFKSLIERATGIFKNMVGSEEVRQKTATETQAIVAGQSARQSQMVDKIYSNLIIPVIEKVADTTANEQFGTAELYQFDKSNNKGNIIQITDETRNGNYRYIYSDSKSNAEKITKFKEMLSVIKEFLQDQEVNKKIDKIELFKMTLETLGFDNTGRIIFDDKELIEKNVNDINKEKVIQEYAKQTLN